MTRIIATAAALTPLVALGTGLFLWLVTTATPDQLIYTAGETAGAWFVSCIVLWAGETLVGAL